jgi:hypothetical protein
MSISFGIWVLPHSAWFHMGILKNPAETPVSKPQIQDGTTIKPMHDILDFHTASTPSAEEANFATVRDDRATLTAERVYSYPNRTFTGWIAPASPDACKQIFSSPGRSG